MKGYGDVDNTWLLYLSPQAASLPYVLPRSIGLFVNAAELFVGWIMVLFTMRRGAGSETERGK